MVLEALMSIWYSSRFRVGRSRVRMCCAGNATQGSVLPLWATARLADDISVPCRRAWGDTGAPKHVVRTEGRQSNGPMACPELRDFAGVRHIPVLQLADWQGFVSTLAKRTDEIPSDSLWGKIAEAFFNVRLRQRSVVSNLARGPFPVLLSA